jgi:hypothetical protein
LDESLQQQLEQAMGEFTKQHQALLKAREELSSLSVTVRSKDRVVEVTVGAQGDPTGLRFLNNKHQKMTGQELASSVLEAMSLARQELAGRVQSGFDSVAGDSGLGIAGSGLENLDLERILGSLGAGGMVGPSSAASDRSADTKRSAGGGGRGR